MGSIPVSLGREREKTWPTCRTKKKSSRKLTWSKAKSKSSKKKKKKNFIIYIALIAFSVYAVVTLVNQQIQINQKKAEYDELVDSSYVWDVKIKEISEVYNSDDKDNAKYIEKFAREEFDYANKDERIFINIAGD